MNKPNCSCTEVACHTCELIAGRPDYVEKWNVPEAEVKAARKRIRRLKRAKRKTTAKRPPAEPCDYKGSPIVGPKAPDLIREWHECDHPQRVELGIADAVCACRGCHRNCKGYRVSDAI